MKQGQVKRVSSVREKISQNGCMIRLGAIEGGLMYREGTVRGLLGGEEHPPHREEE